MNKKTKKSSKPAIKKEKNNGVDFATINEQTFVGKDAYQRALYLQANTKK